MRLLLHTCCGPCLSGVHPALIPEKHEVTAYFFNPNIHPKNEFNKRLGAVKAFAGSNNIDLIVKDEYGQELFEKEVMPDKDRCAACYRLRLNQAAKYAKDNKYEAYSTTLLISPYQRHEDIRKVGEEMGNNYGIIFMYRDFRLHYKSSVLASKELGLYRQKYCGCYLSEKENG